LRLYGNSPQVKVNITLRSCKITSTTVDLDFKLDTVYNTSAVSKHLSLFYAKRVNDFDMLTALYSDTVATGNSGEIVASLKLDFSAIPKNNKPDLTVSFKHVTPDCMRFESFLSQEDLL
jgi:hypothetical protein